MSTERQREIGRLHDAIASGNYNGDTLRRFRRLLAEEVQPMVEAALPAIAEQARRREQVRRAAAAAGLAAGRRFAARLQRR